MRRGSNSTLVNRMGRNYPYPWSFPRRIDTYSLNSTKILNWTSAQWAALCWLVDWLPLRGLLFVKKNALFFSAFKPDTIILLKLTGWGSGEQPTIAEEKEATKPPVVAQLLLGLRGDNHKRWAQTISMCLISNPGNSANTDSIRQAKVQSNPWNKQTKILSITQSS